MFRKKVSSLSSFIQKTFTEHLYVTDTVLEDVTKKWIGSTCKWWEAHDLLRKQTTYERVLEKYELPRMRTDLSREITTGLILENEVSPLHGAPALFHTTGHWGESRSHHSDLHISHQEFHPQYILITYLWTCDTGHEDLGMCCSDLPSRTLPLVAGSASSGQSSASRASGGQPLCNDPSRWRHKGLASGHVRATLKGHLHSRALKGQLRSSGPWTSLVFSLCSIQFLHS